ncbi:MAG: metallophosphoesterase [Cytophagaceae bacterium]|jgi:predicted MPP superfamily phosphohydrolase|nr:metallophosphoesterase [Cytophagaceae bacterium]
MKGIGKLWWLLLLLAELFFVYGCEKFEFSPYQTKGAEPLPQQINARQIDRLINAPHQDDTITVIFIGDSQRFYDELDDLVHKANQLPSVDFLILAGDITDFGLRKEYAWILERLERLRMPYMAAIGNHDLVANGSEIFESTFGPKNFSFVYHQHKFIFHDTNGREYGFNESVPSIPWLRTQMITEEPYWYIGVAHMPPHHEDFDRNLEHEYVGLWSSNPRSVAILSGHNHDTGDAYHYNDHVRYITSNAVEKRSFLLLKIHKGQIAKQLIEY